MLYALLKKKRYDVRYRVCMFLWSSLGIPKSLRKIPHENDCTHTYLEVRIKGSWNIVDPAWDWKLRKILPVNDWDGFSATKLAVKPIVIFSPKKSLHIIRGESKAVIKKDLEKNGKFYAALNKWLEKIRLNLKKN